MEGEKSHNLPSANWRLGKASGVIHSKSKGLRNGGADDVHLSRWASEDEVRPPTLGRVTGYTDSTDSNANFTQKCPHGQTQKCLVRYVGTPDPVKLTHKITCHRCPSPL